jgi:hypothetical protein
MMREPMGADPNAFNLVTTISAPFEEASTFVPG